MQLGTRIRTKNRGKKTTVTLAWNRQEETWRNVGSWTFTLLCCQQTYLKSTGLRLSNLFCLVPRKHVCIVLNSWSQRIIGSRLVDLIILTLLRNYLGTDIMPHSFFSLTSSPQRNREWYIKMYSKHCWRYKLTHIPKKPIMLGNNKLTLLLQ